MRIQSVVGAVLAVALLAVPRATPAARAGPEWPLTVESLPSPAGGESASPQLTVEGDRVILSWMERADTRGTLKFAERAASGWSAVHTVASGTNLVVNAADVPSV